MLLYHCADPCAREPIGIEGIRPTEVTDDLRYVFCWPDFDSADEWRESQPGGWKDIWEFDDRDESIDSPGASISSLGVVARAVPRAVPPEDGLKLVYRAY